MFQYLSLFIEMCEDFVYITGMKRLNAFLFFM